jgi:hypothetical protein
MSTQNHRTEESHLGTDRGRTAEPYSPFVTPHNSQELCSWLDEQPGFIEVQRTTTLYRHDRDSRPDFPTTYAGTSHFKRVTVCEREKTELLHVNQAYEVTSRASHTSQSDVRDAWEEMQFPAHNFGRFEGRQGAELYTLSSYQDHIEGPSEYNTWTREEEPTTVYHCEVCGQTLDSLSGGYRSTGLDDHFAKSHPNLWLTDARYEAHIGGDKLSSLYYEEESGTVRTVSEKNFYAVQFPDGSGVMVHYDTIAAVRTRHGVVLKNRQDFANGRARVTPPSRDERDASVPLSGLRDSDLLGDKEVFDIAEVESYETGESTRYGDDVTVAYFDSGGAILFAYDSTAKEFHERHCATRLNEERTTLVRQSENPLDAVKPDEVLAAEARGLEVVPADDFGGDGSPYRDSRLGESVIRQGEWWFVPMDESFSPDEPVYHPHARTSDGKWDLPDSAQYVDSLPTECADCGASSFEVRPDATACTECGFEHYDADQLNEHGRPSLGSHYAREMAFVDGDIYVRGTVKHQRSEHSMFHLEDRWHLAAENLTDFVVFDTSTPSRTSGRSGGIARVE